MKFPVSCFFFFWVTHDYVKKEAEKKLAKVEEKVEKKEVEEVGKGGGVEEDQ